MQSNPGLADDPDVDAALQALAAGEVAQNTWNTLRSTPIPDDEEDYA
jgi:hypothetical protein